MIKLKVTAYANGTLTSHSQQQIRSALEAKLGRGIRHPLFDKLISEAAQAVAKAAAAEAPRYLRIHQTPQTLQTIQTVTPEALRCFRIHEIHERKP